MVPAKSITNKEELLENLYENNYNGTYKINDLLVEYENLNGKGVKVTLPTENLQITTTNDATRFSLIDPNGLSLIETQFDLLPFYNEKVIIDEGITGFSEYNDRGRVAEPIITEFHLPSTLRMNVEDVDYCLFNYAKNITVDENNPNYSSIDGVLFNKDGTELLKYPDASERTSYTVPDSVKTIVEFSFVTCKNLSELYIPNNVTTIKADAFSHCESLTDVTIPEYINTANSFWNCSEFERHTTEQSLDDILNSLDTTEPDDFSEPTPVSNDEISI